MSFLNQDNYISPKEQLLTIQILYLDWVKRFVDIRKDIVRRAAASNAARQFYDNAGYHVTDQEIADLKEMEGKDAN